MRNPSNAYGHRPFNGGDEPDRPPGEAGAFLLRAQVVEAARVERPDLRIIYHSDGHFDPILDDLVELGVNGINPLQPEHMDGARIRRRFGASLALWGTVGHQSTFGRTRPEDIRREVQYRIETLGRAGLILCPAYDVDEPDIPWENVAAFLDAARRYG